MKTKNKLLTTLLALMLVSTSIIYHGNSNAVKANALSPDYNLDQAIIYYFCDAVPSFENALSNITIGYPIIYDTKYALTAGELEYMLYSGYFWGFNEYVDNIVIFELKTMKPDYHVLEEIFKCFHMQNCKVMFISPYYMDYSDITYIDVSMECNFDSFMRFWKKCVRGIYNDESELPCGTTLFLDGKFIGLSSYTQNTTLSDLCTQSQK